MSQIKQITDKLIEFRDERNWEQFHNPKDLATAIAIEAAELNELFLWKRDASEWEEVDRERLADELADVLAFAFLLAQKYDFDIKEIMLEKIRKNGQKYPVDKSYNSSSKYDEL